MKRRDFIQNASTASIALFLANYFSDLKGSSQNFKEMPNSNNDMISNNSSRISPDDISYLGFFDEKQIVAETIKVFNDKLGLNWLSKGDSVFIKVSSNSGNLHPAVTSPIAIATIVKVLKDAGAGEIIVGDQAGVQHVRLTKSNRNNSTKEMFAKNGIQQAIEKSQSKLYCFDDYGWDSYYSPELDFQNLWNNEIYIPKIIKDVDHIIYLPRLSSHCMAGYSGGLKIAVGFLRDDSRLSLHRDGENFNKKIAEINYILDIRNKLRLVVTIADKALLHFGPDMGKIHEIGKTMLLASNNIVQHDYLSAAVLNWYSINHNSVFKIMPKMHFPKSVSWNNFLVKSTWGKEEREKTTTVPAFKINDLLENHPAIYHYCNLSGYKPSKFQINAEYLDADLKAYLKEYGTNRFEL
jgi:uncharacterized protein (DUF362 family)